MGLVDFRRAKTCLRTDSLIIAEGWNRRRIANGKKTDGKRIAERKISERKVSKILRIL